MITDRAAAWKDGEMASAAFEPDDAEHMPGPDNWRDEIARIYRSHGGFVQRMATHLGVADAHLDDVIHDVFIIAYRRLPDFDEALGSIRAWLFGITRRVVLHHRRGHAQHRRRLSVVPTPAPSPRPDEVLAQQRASDHVAAFLAGLDPRKRTVFVLVDVEGMSAVDVARSLNANVNTVYARLRAARRAFNDYLVELDARAEVNRAP